jgi:tetratricopeptide (TPR) repeat protein
VEEVKGSGLRTTMLVAFAASLLVRIVYTLSLRQSPFFNGLIVDAQWHDQWAWDWARGAWSMGGHAFFRAPLYPFFLSLIYRVFGHDLLAVRIVQAVVGASTVAALAGCGWRIGGKRMALWAAAIGALYGPLIFFDGELLIPNLLVALLAWSLFFLLAAPSLCAELLAALFLGLAVIARPNAVVLLPVFLYFGWSRHRGAEHVRKGTLVWMTIVALIPAACITLVNAREEKTFVFVASQGGVNFYAGNHPGATGRTVEIPEMKNVQTGWSNFVEASQEVAEKAEGKRLNSREVSNYWLTKGLDWIVSAPGDAAVLTLKKIYYVVNAYEVPNERDLYFRRPFPLNLLLWRLPFFAFPWGLIFPLAVAGALAGRRDRERKQSIGALINWTLVLGLFLVPFFITARFRMDIVPALILLAAYALSNREKTLRTAPVAMGLAALLFVNTSFFQARVDNPAEEKAKAAMALIMENRLAESRELLQQALTADPRSADYTFLMGYAYSLEKDNDNALKYYQRSLELNPTNYKVLYYLGISLLEMQRYGEAATALEKAAGIRPTDGSIWLNLGSAYDGGGEAEKAIDAYRRCIQAAPQEPRGYVNLGLMYQKQGDMSSAITAWRLGENQIPGDLALHFNLAVAYAQSGQLQLGRQEVERAIQIEPGNSEALRLRDWIKQQMGQ